SRSGWGSHAARDKRSSDRGAALVHGSCRDPGGDALMPADLRSTERNSSVAPAVIVVMGVSGSGKSTLGALLARRLQWEFEDADWFHPASNVEKMNSGIPLTDEARARRRPDR